MLFWAQNNLALQSGAWWEIWPPCIAIMLTVHGMNYLFRGHEWHTM